MEWLENITDNTILRNILGSGPQPNKVFEVKPEQYENREKLLVENGIVLYSPNDKAKEKYEIVIESSKSSVKSTPCTYSVFRSDDSETAEELFAVYKDKVPYLIGISKDICNTNGIRKLCDALTKHPTWNLAHLGSYLLCYEAFEDPSISCYINIGDDASGESPLQVAIQTNDLKMVQILLAAGSSLEHLDHSANGVYHYAVHSSKEIIAALGEASLHGIDARNSGGYTPLHVACLGDRPESVKALLMLGANVNIPPIEGPAKEPADVAEFLREKPDALNCQEMKYGGTPIHWSNGKDVIVSLLEKNCDVDAVNFDGRTALHVMVVKQKLDCVVVLLTRMASVNVVDKNGNTPLHLAVSQSGLGIVQALLSFGAEVDAENYKRETPRHLTSIVNKTEGRKILYMLHAVGAQRCPQDMEGCHVGCKHRENFDGDAPPEPPSAVPRTVLDQMLYVAGVEKLASEGERRSEGGRLLCLDGGGIRGLVLVQTLLEIESLIKKPIVNCFDWIAGTSTGGILALGLAAGRSLRECQVIYFNVKEKAFVGYRPYSNEGLEDILKTALGSDTVMADIHWPKLIITTVLADRMPVDLHIFRNYESPSNLLGVQPSGKFKETFPPERQLAWKAARATGAAPTYFRAFGRFLDGGLIANNPTLDAMTEIEEYNLALRAIGRGDEVKPLSMVVSLGTGRIPVSPMKDIDVFKPESIWDTAKIAKGISALGNLLVEQATASDGRVVDRARTWCSTIGVPYYRFNPQISDEIAMDESSDEKLVNMMWEVKAFMYANRNQVKELAALLYRQ